VLLGQRVLVSKEQHPLAPVDRAVVETAGIEPAQGSRRLGLSSYTRSGIVALRARRRSRLRFWEMMDRIDAMEKKLVGHELHRLTSAYLEACRFRV
jgi:hypothetical protein